MNCRRMPGGYLQPDTAQQLVSIHIRHCWRMNFCTDGVTVQDAEFQSTFAIAGE